MTVYVDNAHIPHKGKLWCHLMADTPTELYLFAAKIGLKPAWLHGDHYDVTEWMRERAVKAGAIEATPEKMVEIRRKLRREAKEKAK